MKNLIVGIFLLMVSTLTQAQLTTLTTGDIAFVGFNADGADGVSFVTFVDIPANTKIFFRDDEWGGTSFNDAAESISIWRSGSNIIPAGTIVEFSNFVVSAGISNYGTYNVTGTNPGNSTSGDAIFAYIGPDSLSPVTFLAGISSGTASGPSGFGTLSGTGLLAGVTAFVFPTGTPDIGAYTGSRVGSFTLAKTNIFNTSNWITQDATGDQSADGTAPDVPFDKTPFTLSTTTSGDIIPPTVTKAITIDNKNILLVFSEDMKPSTLTISSNFIGIGTIGNFDIQNKTSNGDSLSLRLSQNLVLGYNYTLTISGVQDLAGNVISSPYLYNFSVDARKEVYLLKKSPLIGSSQGFSIYLGGNSGLIYKQGSDKEFYAVTDRGANADMGSGKLFCVPSFNPQIIRYKAEADSLRIIETIGLKRPDGSLTTGMINPVGSGGTGESAYIDINSTLGTPDVWGIDSEGIAQDATGGFWISEEYGASIWHTNSTGKVLNRYVPFKNKQLQDIGIDTVLKYRNPNKGLEGLAVTPSGKVYGFMQGPIFYPSTASSAIKSNSRLHRIVEMNPFNNQTTMYGYEHDSPAESTVSTDKNYIGDATAINDTTFLVLEHGVGSKYHAKVYKVSIVGATPITQEFYNSKSFEQLYTASVAGLSGIKVVKKTLFLDLTANGYGLFDKPEGLAIINDSTIAVANDNDFGIVSPNADGQIVSNGVKSYVYIFTVAQNKKLVNYVPVIPSTITETVDQNSQDLFSGSLIVFPNPVNGNEINFNKSISGTISNELGIIVKQFSELKTISIEGLENGFYLIKTNEGIVKKLFIE